MYRDTHCKLKSVKDMAVINCKVMSVKDMAVLDWKIQSVKDMTVLDCKEKSVKDMAVLDCKVKSVKDMAVLDCKIKSVKDMAVLDCKVKSVKDMAVLDAAIKRGDQETVELLLANGLDVNSEDSNNNTSLLRLISGHTASGDMCSLLIQAGASVNHRNRYGESPLMLAALENNLDSLTFLCKAGADVNLKSSEEDENALSFVFHYFDSEFPVGATFECAEYLLEQGADAAYIRPRVLHKLISHGNLELLQKLISAGMGPANDATDNSMNYFYLQVASPLRSALFWGRPKIARFFLDRLFLTASDIMDHEDFRRLRQRLEPGSECSDLLNEITSQPMSLKNLTFVAVSSAIGSGPQRRDRIRQLRLPPYVKRRLFFLC
ncbi:unnamed protein product [Lymnaea stagnalis]|uniref:Uncharacterized protein n=1 Tax=Lymnaea stagnalis TaxID=6523 RepID=A0AAV2HXS9_LYMST